MFDLDDTLIHDKKSIKKAFEETCKIAAIKYDIEAVFFEEKVRECAKALYSSYDVYPFTKRIGINPFEGLWGTFDDDGEDFQKLREIAPLYQRSVWANGLQAVGIEDKELAIELATAFSAFRKQFSYVFDDTYSVLDQLKGDYSLVLLTNGAPSLQRAKLGLTSELAGYFDEIIVSGDFGIGKPDSTIFQYVLDRVAVTKDEVIMVGDNLNTDILGANRVGIKSVWVNRNQKVTTDIQPTFHIEKLKELIGILNKLGEVDAV